MLGEILGEHLRMPVPVVKDTLAAVIGENWVRGGESLDSTMVFVYIGTTNRVPLGRLWPATTALALLSWAVSVLLSRANLLAE